MSYRGRSFLMLLVTSKTIEKWWHVISHSFRIARRNSRIKLVKSQKSLRFPIVWWCHGVEAWWPASWRVRSLWTRCHSVESSKRCRGGVLGWLFFRIYEIYVRIESYIIVIYVLFWKHTKTYYNGMDSYMLLYMLAYFLQCFFTRFCEIWWERTGYWVYMRDWTEIFISNLYVGLMLNFKGLVKRC